MTRFPALQLLSATLFVAGCLNTADIGTDAGSDAGQVAEDAGNGSQDAGLEQFCANWRDGGSHAPGCPVTEVPPNLSAEGWRMIDGSHNEIGAAPAGSVCTNGTTICHPCSKCDTVNVYVQIDPLSNTNPCTCIRQ